MHVLTACESTVSPQLVEWVDDLVTLPKDKFLADSLTAGDRNMLLSMNVTSMAVHYGVTRQTVRSWVNELKSGSLGESILVQLRVWVHHMCVNPRQRFMSEKGSGVMSMSVTDLAAEYGVTESTVNTWLKAISQPATESADIPASMLDEIGTIPDQDSVVELARSFKVTERYVRKRISDRNRANFLDSGDVDLSDEEIAAKYGIRKASVTSWKAEAVRMWYSWFAQVDLTETEPIQTEVLAAVSLPTIATAESLRYMLRNVGDNDMLTDYVHVMSQELTCSKFAVSRPVQSVYGQTCYQRLL